MEDNNMTNDVSIQEKAVAHFKERIKNTFIGYLGLELLKCESGYCFTRLKIKPEFVNPIGGIHGGLLYTVADTTAGSASIHYRSDSIVTTVSGDMQFLRPALNLDYIFAEANVVKDGKRLVFTDVWIKTEDGTLLAKGSFTFARIKVEGIEPPK